VPTAFNAERGKFVYDNIIPSMLETLPDALIALVVLLVLSASMSTLASLVLTSSSTMTLDLIYRDKKSTDDEVREGEIDDMIAEKIERRKVVIMRVLIVFFIVISLMIALNPPQFIAQLMGISWGALAGAFLAPFLYGLYWKGASRISVWVSFIFSTVVMLANMLVRSSFPTLLQSPINAGAFCMIAGLIIIPVVSLFTPKPDQKVVDDAFACYEEKVLVPQSEALGEKE
jgi:SSS family solute:Na+ symporter